MEEKKELTQKEKAINILIEVAKLSQKAGLLTLDDAVLVKSSIDVLQQQTIEQQTIEKEK